MSNTFALPAQPQDPGADKGATNTQLGVVAPANVAAALQASSAASQFAAGFAAATALSHQQFRCILGQALAAATNPNAPAPQYPATVGAHQ